MSANPMRSVIRILSDSSLVNKIALDHDNNNVKVFYKSDDKHAQTVCDLVDIINYYFNREYDSEEAIVLVGKTTLPKRKNYYINSYTSTQFEFFRIDIQNDDAQAASYYEPSADIMAVELMCLERARDFIIAELRKKQNSRKAVIEINFNNFCDPEMREEYVAELKRLAPTMAKNMEISLVRIAPDISNEKINETVALLAKHVSAAGVSLFFEGNTDRLETMLGSDASRVFVTVDFKQVTDEEKIEALHDTIMAAPKPYDVFIIQQNIDTDAKKMIGERNCTLRYAGRQVVKRA